MLGQTQFVGLEFGIFGGFRWVRSSIWVDEPGFGRVRSSVFPDLGLGSTYFWPKGSKFGHFAGFKRVRSSVLVDEPGFEWVQIRPVKFEAVQSLLYLGLEQGFRESSPPITRSLHRSHLNKGCTHPVTMLQKPEKCPVQYWDTVCHIHPSWSQTSEILWKTLGIHDLEHSEGGVNASFKWDLCSDWVKTKAGMPKAFWKIDCVKKSCSWLDLGNFFCWKQSAKLSPK